jgi:hypothetical protein
MADGQGPAISVDTENTIAHIKSGLAQGFPGYYRQKAG